ncbi:type II CAAX endopeptidase family protein [Arthrobacter roseus]|uniref:CPBP family intramembrane glutamic endopeptidase n=1 Tax=Arthrobacter roseus TaxID=136274 RepID=UPI0030842EB9|nr:membrane protease YdiL (CAAX protease family) [Arthrobacter roseus]
MTFFLAFTLLLIGTLLAIAFTTGEGLSALERMAELDLSDPLTFGFAMVSVILMLPSIILATLITGPRPLGTLSSVVGRLRWKWLMRCGGLAVVIYGLSFGLTLMLPSGAGEELSAPGFDAGTFLPLLIMTLLLVPIQATAEEYVFRGYLMQTIGGWLKHPAFAILLPVPLFVLGHAYEPLGQIDIALFAIFAGWITWRTGGLEAAIAAHVINNVTIFLLGSVGLADVNATTVQPIALLVSVLTLGAYGWLVVRMADRRAIHRTVPVRAVDGHLQGPIQNVVPNA